MKKLWQRSVKVKGGYFRPKKKKKWIKLQPDSSKHKERGIKSTKLEMKKEKLQLTSQKYKHS